MVLVVLLVLLLVLLLLVVVATVVVVVVLVAVAVAVTVAVAVSLTPGNAADSAPILVSIPADWLATEPVHRRRSALAGRLGADWLGCAESGPLDGTVPFAGPRSFPLWPRIKNVETKDGSCQDRRR